MNFSRLMMINLLQLNLKNREKNAGACDAILWRRRLLSDKRFLWHKKSLPVNGAIENYSPISERGESGGVIVYTNSPGRTIQGPYAGRGSG